MIKLIDDEDEKRVSEAAVDTLESWEKREVLESVLHDFVASSNMSNRRWPLLDAMIAIGDPGDQHGRMPKWLATALSQMDWYMRRYTDDELEKRRKKLRSDADWEDRSRE